MIFNTMNNPLSPHDCIFHLLAKASRAGTRHWKNTIADLEITAVQAMALSFLHTHGAVTVSELSELVALDNATLTGLIDRLQKMGLVTREAKAQDRRAFQIHLTDHGQAIAAEVQQRLAPANAKFLEALSFAEVAMLKELLKRL